MDEYIERFTGLLKLKTIRMNAFKSISIYTIPILMYTFRTVKFKKIPKIASGRPIEY